MPKVFTSRHQKIGELGETIAVRFLVKQGYEILERNYTKPWGEIDIIAIKDSELHFIEVKSVTEKTSKGQSNLNQKDNHIPEENMHSLKIKRITRTIETYLSYKKIGEEVEWQIDLIIVILNFDKEKARIKLVKNIIL